MKKIAVRHLQQQEKVNAYFQTQASFWKDIYSSSGVYAEIHRDRHAAVLAWIDSLALAPGSRVLEIGCGAGFMSIALAQRGYCVNAIDSIETMVEQARQLAAQSQSADLLTLEVGDVYSLAFEKETFDLVIAVGVIPWLEQPELAIQEMSRVTKPGGYVILTADNRARLNNLLDPWLHPALAPLKQRLKVAMERANLRHRSLKDVGASCHSRHFIDEALAHVELVKVKGMTLGFGPFSLFRHNILPETLGTALHHRLQNFADHGMPIFHSMGAHYLVLSRKPASEPILPSTHTENLVALSDARQAL